MFNRGAQVLDSLAARAYAAVELDDSPLLFPSSYSSFIREKHLERDFSVMEMRAACSCNVGKLIESIELVTIQSVCLLMLTPPSHLVSSILIYTFEFIPFSIPLLGGLFVCVDDHIDRSSFFNENMFLLLPVVHFPSVSLCSARMSFPFEYAQRQLFRE